MDIPDQVPKGDKASKPYDHSQTIDWPNPLHPVQALFSKEAEDLDPFEVTIAPMSCRVDFADNILSQELLTLVSRWNGGRRSPELTLPILKKFKKHSGKLRAAIDYSIPILIATACVAYYWRQTSKLDSSALATTGLIRFTVQWLAISGGVLLLASRIAKWLSSFSLKHIVRFGHFTLFEITNGDENKQNELQAKSRNSIYKFLFACLVALILNVLAGLITAYLLK